MASKITQEDLKRMAKFIKILEDKGWDAEAFIGQLEEWADLDSILSSATTQELEENDEEIEDFD